MIRNEHSLKHLKLQDIHDLKIDDITIYNHNFMRYRSYSTYHDVRSEKASLYSCKIPSTIQ